MSKPIKITDQNKAWNRTRQKGSSYAINSRKPDKLFLIICEGQNTEPDYFKAFPLASAQVKTVGKGETKTKLVESVLKHCQQTRDCEDREVWVVFDMDRNPPQAVSQIEDANKALELAENKGYNVAFSNDAFEFWILLHYQEVSGPLTRKQLYEKLSRHLGIDYEKEGKKKQFTLTLYQKLQDDPDASQDKAIQRANHLIKKAEESETVPSQANPYTSVVNLVEELNRYL